jgi:hypothetical protein
MADGMSVEFAGTIEPKNPKAVLILNKIFGKQ